MFFDGSMVAGSALGVASMFSVGPTNLMLIREGLTAGRIFTVPATVATFYVAMISVSCGFSVEISHGPPYLRALLSWIGIVAILYFAKASFQAALGRACIDRARRAHGDHVVRCVARVLAVVVFNPLVYVELCFVPAAICATFDGPSARASFTLGLAVVSVIYCFLFAFAGRLFAPLLASPRRLQAIDFSSGLILLSLAGVTAVQILRAS